MYITRRGMYSAPNRHNNYAKKHLSTLCLLDNLHRMHHKTIGLYVRRETRYERRRIGCGS